MDENYLNLFNDVRGSIVVKNYDLFNNGQEIVEKNEMLKETPDYKSFEKLNETPLYNIPKQDLMNDSWSDLIIEKRINGQRKLEMIMQNRMNNITQQSNTLNEVIDLSNYDVVTVDIFERVNYLGLNPIATKFKNF